MMYDFLINNAEDLVQRCIDKVDQPPTVMRPKCNCVMAFQCF
jgi:hypothetical protein